MVELEQKLKDAIETKQMYYQYFTTERAERGKVENLLQDERLKNEENTQIIIRLRAKVARLETLVEDLQRDAAKAISAHKKANVHGSLAELKMLGSLTGDFPMGVGIQTY
jgi:hypothetical protein